jgi:hypothetical protein
VDGDKEALGVEAVQLDQSVIVGRGAVDDEEDELVVVLDLRPLVELLGVFHGKQVELENVAEDLEVTRIRLVEVEPEEVAGGQQLRGLLPTEAELVAPAFMADVADRPTPARRSPPVGPPLFQGRPGAGRSSASPQAPGEEEPSGARRRRVRRRKTTLVTIPRSQPSTVVVRMIQTSEA